MSFSPNHLPTSPLLVPLSLSAPASAPHRRGASLPTNSLLLTASATASTSRHSLDFSAPSSNRTTATAPGSTTLSMLKYIRSPSDDEEGEVGLRSPRQRYSRTGKDGERYAPKMGNEKEEEEEGKWTWTGIKNITRLDSVQHLFSNSRMSFIFLVIILAYFGSFLFFSTTTSTSSNLSFSQTRPNHNSRNWNQNSNAVDPRLNFDNGVGSLGRAASGNGKARPLFRPSRSLRTAAVAGKETLPLVGGVVDSNVEKKETVERRDGGKTRKRQPRRMRM